MNSKTAISALVLAAMIGAGASGVALAQAGGPAADARPAAFDFEALDADKDGKVTKDEMKAAQAARAVLMDTDKDGKISEAELVAMHTRDIEARAVERAKRILARQDTDGDGMLTAAELMATDRPMDKMFDRIDADNDGAISKAEAEAMQDRMADRRDGRKGKHKRGHDSN